MSTTIREPTYFQPRRRISEIMLVNSLILVSLSQYALAWGDWPACPADMIRVKVDYQSSRCCYDITCRAGFEPTVCTKDDPNPTCVECSEGTYQPKSSMLSHHQWNKCRVRTNCEVTGMKYRSFGNTTINSICECTPGYYCDHHMCLPKGRCPVGYGRDAKTGDCLPCALGKTYSDVEHVSEPCKNVTRCKALNLRTVKPATVQRDSICGNRTTTDDDDNGGFRPVPTEALDVVVTIKSPATRNDTGGSRDHPVDPGLGNKPILLETNESDDNTKHQITHSLIGWVGGTLTFAILVVIALVVRWRKVKIAAQLKLRAHRNIERLDKRYEDAANMAADLEIFIAALEETSALYPKLGKVLLNENRMKEFETQRKERHYTFVEMIHIVLDEWKESEGEELSSLAPNLYTALKEAKMYETICLIAQKVTTGSNQSTDSTKPLIQSQGGQHNLGSTDTDSEN